MTHTPGPWRSEQVSEGEWRVLSEVSRALIVAVRYGSSAAEVDANARLIAKAYLVPELVAACELAIATLRHHEADQSYLGELPVVRDLECVLAKAKGQ